MWQCNVGKMWTKQHSGVTNPSKEEKNIQVQQVKYIKSTDVGK
jgi:hypothetical protein